MSVSTATQEIKVYSYRWVVLLTFMFISLTMQIFWICYAPIMGIAAEYFGVTDLEIGLLALLFMFIYILLAIPASWAIDTWGFKKAVALGAVLMGVFGLLRGLFPSDYNLAVIFTIGIAAAQPLFLNAGTKLVALWFPLQERATVVGVGAGATLMGVFTGLIATPPLVNAYGIGTTMLIYGVVGAISSILFLLLARDHPPTPAGYEVRVAMTEGFWQILKLRNFYLLAIVYFVINAIFNGFLTWVEVILRPKGMDSGQAGTIGGLLIIGGIVGVFILPPISDRMRKRIPALVAGLVATIPFLVLVTILNNFVLLAIDSFLLGLFLVGIIPVALQYGTELFYPAPEGTSGGLVTLAGQISAIPITVMGLYNEVFGSFTPSLLVLAGATVVSALLLLFMKESRLLLQAQGQEQATPSPAQMQ